MTDLSSNTFKAPQALVAGDVAERSLTARVGAVTFPVGGARDTDEASPSANPYELLSASLAACTAMTIRQYARRKAYPFTHVEVGVSYHHGIDGGREFFDRSIVLKGELTDEQRARLMLAANLCPVGRTLGLSAQINTRQGNVTSAMSANVSASYSDDLDSFSIVNIDPD